MRKLILKLCELGWFYRKISSFINSHRQDLAFGVVRCPRVPRTRLLVVTANFECSTQLAGWAELLPRSQH
jgi:hypothetical protein